LFGDKPMFVFLVCGQAANDQAWEINKEAKEIDESRCNRGRFESWL
jgi:hypothetical protein